MLPRLRGHGQDVVIQVVASLHQARDSDAGIKQQSESGADANYSGRGDLHRVVQPENQTVKHEPRTEYDARLKTTTRSEVAVELHVEREKQDERKQQFGDDAQYDVMFHQLITRIGFVAKFSAPGQQTQYSDTGGKDHGDLAERIVTAVAREHRGHDIGNTDFGPGLLQIPRHDV